ncbi:MAG: hypothetical protein RL701_843 [Pseudomonadota bacterium]
MSEDRPKHAPTASSPYPMSRLSAKHDLIDIAREIQAADSLLSAVAAGKLESIARQIRALQEEAARTLQEAHAAADLHRAACNFKKIPGQIYHLYQRPNGERYFSLLSPQDWDNKPPHAYSGSYRLETDMRFTPAEDVEAREREWSALRPLLLLGGSPADET